MQDWAKATTSSIESGVEPLTDLYLNSVVSQSIPNHGSLRQIVIVGLIALFVLFTAMISYINLFIIQGEKRITEISTRSMFGATKVSIARLFFLETAFVFLVSAFLAFLISYYSMPYISGILLSKVGVSEMVSGWGIGSVLIVLAILLVVSSGYPVLYLSRMKFALGLRGKIPVPAAINGSPWLPCLFSLRLLLFLSVVLSLSFRNYPTCATSPWDSM